MTTRRVIIVTDGDEAARRALESVSQQVGGRCISASGGNPTPITGDEMVKLILSTPYDPVIVMFDDNGDYKMGKGESALKYVVEHTDIQVLGVIAVASNTPNVKGTEVDFTINKYGKVSEYQVDKHGDIEIQVKHHISGDTVDTLRSLNVPLIVGVGDIGKMDGYDNSKRGYPITRKAVELILHGGKLY